MGTASRVSLQRNVTLDFHLSMLPRLSSLKAEGEFESLYRHKIFFLIHTPSSWRGTAEAAEVCICWYPCLLVSSRSTGFSPTRLLSCLTFETRTIVKLKWFTTNLFHTPS